MHSLKPQVLLLAIPAFFLFHSRSVKKNTSASSFYLAVASTLQTPNDSVPRESRRFTDTDGNRLNAHGAGVLFHKGIYYLYGEIKKGTTWLVPDQGWEDFRVPAGGVSCYSSTDLLHWKNEGVALATYTTGEAAPELDTGRVLERPKVIYNERTKKFVMWMHTDNRFYSDSKAGVAVSDSPEGPFTYLGSVKPNGQMARDMTVFKDNDKKAYLVYSSEDNKTLHVCLLNDDYLAPTATYRRVLIGRSREAPALFRSGNTYYMVTSGCSGWSPNAASYATAKYPMGPWTEMGNPCLGPGAGQTFNAQSTFVLPLAGKPDQFLFMADRWNKTDLEKSDYLWVPLTINKKTVVIKETP